MNKTKIEWCDYTWNPVIGCERGCPYCYAKKMNDRFHYVRDFRVPEWRDRAFNKPMPKKPSRIFVGSMSDICYWENDWIDRVIRRIIGNPQHTFLFLTKDARIYGKYSFPSNCWLGMTYQEHWTASFNLNNQMNTKFISIEPMTRYVNRMDLGSHWDWWIVGGMTPKAVHKQEWVTALICEARAMNKTIFLKSNLHYPEKIQEFPKWNEPKMRDQLIKLADDKVFEELAELVNREVQSDGCRTYEPRKNGNKSFEEYGKVVTITKQQQDEWLKSSEYYKAIKKAEKLMFGKD